MSHQEKACMSKHKFKAIVKTNVKIAAFKYMCELQENSSKMSNLKYHMLKTMDYLHNPMFSQQDASLLYSLRTRTVRGIKSDFPGMYADKRCPLDITCESIDTLSHVLECNVISNNMQTHIVVTHALTLSDIYSDNTIKQ